MPRRQQLSSEHEEGSTGPSSAGTTGSLQSDAYTAESSFAGQKSSREAPHGRGSAVAEGVQKGSTRRSGGTERRTAPNTLHGSAKRSAERSGRLGRSDGRSRLRSKAADGKEVGHACEDQDTVIAELEAELAALQRSKTDAGESSRIEMRARGMRGMHIGSAAAPQDEDARLLGTSQPKLETPCARVSAERAAVDSA